MSFVSPVLHRKQKSSLFEGLQTWNLKVGSARQVSGTHFEWNVHLGRQIPVHVIKVPCIAVSFAPHLAHNSRKLSLVSSISATIVAPSQPGITAPIKSTPCSNLFANWNEKIKLNWCQHLLLKLNRVGERPVTYRHGEYPTIMTVPLNSMLCHNCCQCCLELMTLEKCCCAEEPIPTNETRNFWQHLVHLEDPKDQCREVDSLPRQCTQESNGKNSYGPDQKVLALFQHQCMLPKVIVHHYYCGNIFIWFRNYLFQNFAHQSHR